MLITQPRSKKNQNGPRTSLMGPGGVVWGKNRVQKISWDCPFKVLENPQNEYVVYFSVFILSPLLTFDSPVYGYTAEPIANFLILAKIGGENLNQGPFKWTGRSYFMKNLMSKISWKWPFEDYVGRFLFRFERWSKIFENS